MSKAGTGEEEGIIMAIEGENMERICDGSNAVSGDQW